MENQIKNRCSVTNHRRLRVEPLEDRRMLAVLTVQNNLDDTLANLAGDGQLSLREAIEIANHPGMVIDGFVSNDVADEICFDFGHDGPEKILLRDGELLITDEITITGSGRELLTIDADQQSRIFNIDNPEVYPDRFDATISNLSLTNGLATGPYAIGANTRSGGAIRSDTFGNLTVARSTISGSRYGSSPYARGGGIYSVGNLVLSNSIVRGNFGSGVFAGSGTSLVSDCLIDSNQGGGVVVQKLHMFRSTVINNEGRGVAATSSGDSTLNMIIRSTISNNSWTFPLNGGGGVYAFADLLVLDSTISGNSSINNGQFGGSTRGGGILAYGDTIIENSTIADNHAVGRNAEGGGIWITDASLTIFNSIIAGNTTDDAGPDIYRGFSASPSVDYSLIGDTADSRVTAETGTGNILNQPALLGPLADNGGPTLPNGAVIQTHALLPGSPALDAGDPTILFDPNQFDQRGDPFTRVAVGVLTGVPPTPRIDIGSYEAQAPPSADFNNDLVVDGKDFLSWQRAFGHSNAAAAGDSDHDGDADASDLAAWQVSYGVTIILPPLTAAIEATEDEPASRAGAVERVLSLTMFETAAEDEDFLLEEPTGAEVAHDAVFTRGEYRPADVRRFSTPKLDIPGVHAKEEKSAEPSTAVLLARALED